MNHSKPPHGGKGAPKSQDDGDCFRREDAADERQDYPVGYGKPPQHSRFKPGQSGNNRGRPKRSKNMSSRIRDLLDSPISVVQNGQRKRVPFYEAMLTTMQGAALKGNVRTQATLLALRRDLDSSQQAEEEPEHDHEDILRLGLERLQRRSRKLSDDGPSKA